VLHRLRDDGNTVVVIEHNLDVIKTADWVIDLGPEGGHRGGTILATGTPEEIAKLPHSHTGRFLARCWASLRRLHAQGEAAEKEVRRMSIDDSRPCCSACPLRCAGATWMRSTTSTIPTSSLPRGGAHPLVRQLEWRVGE
jgi:hypothetical protein